MKNLKVVAFLLMLFSVSAFTACSGSDTSDSSGGTAYTGDGSGSGTVYAVGDTGPSGVGIVFYVTDGGLHGLEVAPEDQSTGDPWSTTTGTAIGTTSADIGTGMANTNAIILQHGAAGNSAAKICRNYNGGGKTDWFLPSKNEMIAIWENLVRQPKSGGGWENSGTGSFLDMYYWNSTEYDASQGCELYFYSGQQNFDTKTYSNNRVRAIRAF